MKREMLEALWWAILAFGVLFVYIFSEQLMEAFQ